MPLFSNSVKNTSVMVCMTFQEETSVLSLTQGPLISWQKEQMTCWNLLCARQTLHSTSSQMQLQPCSVPGTGLNAKV